VECRWTAAAVAVDGASEAAWNAAQRIETASFGAGEGEHRGRAGVRFLWDRDNLYVLAGLPAGAGAARREARAPASPVETLTLLLEPADGRGGYELEVNRTGSVAGRFLVRRPDAGAAIERRELPLTARAARASAPDRDGRLMVEALVPWRDLVRGRGRPEPGEAWTIRLPGGDGKELPLRFVGPDARGGRPFGIERRIPLTTSRVLGSPDPPPPYRARRVYPKLTLTYPVTVVAEPGSDRLIAIVQDEPGGTSRILRFRDRPDVDSVEQLMVLDRTAYDILFHPRFAETGHFYVSSKGPLSVERPGRKMQVARYTMARQAPFGIDPASERVIIDWPSDGHDGGGMVFGRDGMFYVTSGDGTSDSDTNLTGQDMTKLLAKLLRIDVDHPAPGRTYSVPADNPFVGMRDVRPETWAFGFRNPWRMTVDRETGHIWVGNGGQDLWETAHLVERGANYGWSVYEGSHPFYPKRALGPAPLTRPTLEHPHSESRSLTGGLVYYGRRFPELRGAYIYGDYSTGKIWAAQHDGTRLLWHREIADTQLQIVCFGADVSGEIVIVDIGKQVSIGLVTWRCRRWGSATS
jgi:glucose/arabinose dehydrogenase